MDLVDCEPVYEEFDGFDEDITNCRFFEELPATVQSYIKELERIIECPITMFGVGPARDQVMTITTVRNHAWTRGRTEPMARIRLIRDFARPPWRAHKIPFFL